MPKPLPLSLYETSAALQRTIPALVECTSPAIGLDSTETAAAMRRRADAVRRVITELTLVQALLEGLQEYAEELEVQAVELEERADLAAR